MKKLISAVALLSLLATTPAFAQVRRDQVEKAQDRQEIRQDKREIQDDRLDLARLESLLSRFDAARASRNLPGLDAVDIELRQLLAGELLEGRREQGKAQGELSRSQGEVNSDKRELRYDAATGAPPAVAADDRRDLAKDRADRADDRRDAAVEADRQARKRSIARELDSLYLRKGRPALNRKRDLLVELITLARAELRQDAKEIREDKRELREDKREMREDLRQGR